MTNLIDQAVEAAEEAEDALARWLWRDYVRLEGKDDD